VQADWHTSQTTTRATCQREIYYLFVGNNGSSPGAYWRGSWNFYLWRYLNEIRSNCLKIFLLKKKQEITILLYKELKMKLDTVITILSTILTKTQQHNTIILRTWQSVNAVLYKRGPVSLHCILVVQYIYEECLGLSKYVSYYIVK